MDHCFHLRTKLPVLIWNTSGIIFTCRIQSAKYSLTRRTYNWRKSHSFHNQSIFNQSKKENTEQPNSANHKLKKIKHSCIYTENTTIRICSNENFWEMAVRHHWVANYHEKIQEVKGKAFPCFHQKNSRNTVLKTQHSNPLLIRNQINNRKSMKSKSLLE